MGSRPSPLPGALSGTAFGVARALDAGVSARRLRARDLERPFRGVRQPAGTPDSIISRCRAFLTQLPPGGFFCGPTAALVQGIPLPLALESSRILHVAVMPPARPMRRTGIIARQLDIDPARIRVWRDVPVTEPARTWRDLAQHLTVPDLIAAGDFLIHGDISAATVAELEQAIAAARGGRGVPALRQALRHLDARSESRKESLLRMILIDAGITGFVPNLWVTLPRPRVRYRIDMAFPRAMIGIEYQSTYHHDIHQWQQDMTRLSRLRSYGWNMTEVSARDLDDPAELAHRIQNLLARA